MKSFNFKLFSILLIFFLGIIVYSNTFHCSFHFDDKRFIVDNPAIRDLQNLEGIWKYYPCRFIAFFSIALDYHFHQFNVVGYHLFNIAVHIGTAILVWWLVLLTLSTPRMKEDRIVRHANIAALFAGLVFVSHPIQTEAVTYIWQRTASMATLFYLAGLCFYIKSRLVKDSVTASRIYYILSIIAAMAAMFTKEITITLPLMILIYEFIFLKDKGKLNWKMISPFLITLFFIPLTTLLNSSEKVGYIHGSVDVSGGITSKDYILTQFRVMMTYIRLIFLALNQNIDYDYHISRSIGELPTLFSCLFLIALLYSVQRLFSKYKLISFSVIWFLLTLLPESCPYPIKDVIFEHRLYLPMVGYSLFLVSSVYYLLSRSRDAINGVPTIMIIVLAMIIGCNSVLTYQRNIIWKDDISLWTDTIQKSPHKARPYNYLGLAYFNNKEYDHAIVYYTKAIELDSRSGEPYTNRAGVYFKEGNYNKAISDLNKAIEIEPQIADYYFDRGLIYDLQGQFNQALSDYNKAIAIYPDYKGAINNRLVIYKTLAQKKGNL